MLTEKPDNLDTYPAALRDAIRKQRADLKARQLAGQQTVGPWAPAATLVAAPKKKRPKTVAQFGRRKVG
jgi:hypothetical protein